MIVDANEESAADPTWIMVDDRNVGRTVSCPRKSVSGKHLPTLNSSPDYEERLAKLLTPLDLVLRKKAEYDHLQGDGIVLLSETVTYVAEDGKRVTVFHYVYQALTEAGVTSMAQDSFRYKKKVQWAYLVSAQTVQPDGTKLPIKNDAVFLKSPQDEADDSIYNDDIDLVTVYSNVKPGSITESITVLEEIEPKIPGHFSLYHVWNGSWPQYWQRLLVDAPKSYADRIKITTLGQSVPSPVITTPEPARTQLTWEAFNTPKEAWEETEAPPAQIGPLVWLTTLENWDTFVGWYQALIAGTDKLTPDLQTKVDGWTANLKDPAEILQVLYKHVAQDIRYTGFELGKSDFQPHDCGSVWERQYGDCKDKANLLRGMLAYKGIRSWLTLLSTEHSGAVNKASPDYRQFNHCVLNVQLGKQLVFCDPTITYGVPGLVNGSESDRDVLLIKDAHAEWIHTQPFHDAQISYSFDLQLRPTGELAGWVELNTTGYYGASFWNYYKGITKEQILNRLQDAVRAFFPNATVEDVEPLKELPNQTSGHDAVPPPFSIRAYMVLTGVLNQGSTSGELKFPVLNGILPDYRTFKSLHHASYIWSDTEKVSVKIKLPPGWSAPAPAAPYAYDSPEANFQAKWSNGDGILTADCTAVIKQSLFPPDKMETLGAAVTNLKSWSSKSITISQSKEASTSPLAAQTDSELAANLAVMPTGEGELNLIDSEFPSDGNRNARRAALGKISTLFPSDKKSIVEAAIKTSALDLDDEKWPEVISRLQPIIEANRAALDPDTIAWAEYVTGRALQGQNKKEEARLLFQKAVENKGVGPWRRAWAIYEVAQILAETNPTAALDYADQGLGLDSSAIPSLYALYASTAIKNKSADRLRDRLTTLITSKPESLEDILLEVSRSPQKLIEAGHKEEGLALLELLESLSDPIKTGDAFSRSLKNVRKSAQATATYSKMQQELKEILGSFPEIAAFEHQQPKFSSINDAEKSASQHADNGEANEALGCYLRLAIGYPATNDFPVYFWDCVNYTEWGIRSENNPPKEPFFFKLTSLGDELPHDVDAYADTKLLEAKMLQKEGKPVDAAVVFQALIDDQRLADGFQGTISLRSGKNWESLRDYTKALDSYRFGEPFVNSQANAQEAVLRAALLQFDQANKTEALRLIELLNQSTQSNPDQRTEQVKDLIRIAKNGGESPAYWDNWHIWWPQWNAIAHSAGVEELKTRKIVPVIPSLADFRKELSTAQKDKDTKKFFSQLRELALAARCYPNAALEFTNLFSDAEQMLPEEADHLRHLAISILEPLKLNDLGYQRRRIVELLVNYVDTNQDEKALDLMSSQWPVQLEDNSSQCWAAHRVWGIAATKKHQDLEKARAAIEKDLSSSPNAHVASVVWILVDLYNALGQKDSAVHFLETELTQASVMADPDRQHEINTRLENMKNTSLASKRLADGVAEWLKTQRPPWWDYAEPKSTDDPRIDSLETLLNGSEAKLQPAEWVKTELLSPSATILTPATQESAIGRAFATLLQNCDTQNEAETLAKSILENSAFPASLKANFLFDFLVEASNNHQVDSFETFRQSDFVRQMSIKQQSVSQRIELWTKMGNSDSATINAYVKKLSLQPMDDLDLGIIEDAVTWLLQIGDLDSAQAIYQSAAGFALNPIARKTKPEFQLTLLKQINAARRIKPLADACRALCLTVQQPNTIVKPPSFDQQRKKAVLAGLSREAATNFRFYLIKLHQEPLNLNFWLEFMADQPHTEAGASFTLQLIKAALDATGEDVVKASLLEFGYSSFDTDNSSLLERFSTLEQPYRVSMTYPETREMVRCLDLTTRFRQGKPINLEADLVDFTENSTIQRMNRLKICALLQAKDFTKLRTALDNLSAQQMISPALIRTVLPALSGMGDAEEADMERDALNTILYNDVLRTWYQPTSSNLHFVFQDLLGLGSSQNLPDGFVDFAEVHVARAQDTVGFKLLKAYLDKDWNTVVTTGMIYTQAYPTFYSEYWFLGRGLAELGRKEEAVKALTVYCQYSHDQIWYPEAKDLLSKLSVH